MEFLTSRRKATTEELDQGMQEMIQEQRRLEDEAVRPALEYTPNQTTRGVSREEMDSQGGGGERGARTGTEGRGEEDPPARRNRRQRNGHLCFNQERRKSSDQSGW